MNIDLTNKDLIKQYLNGSLDAQTMHAIEKEALEDPFLADALDGLSSNDEELDDSVAQLQYHLAQRINQKKGRFLPVFDTQRYMVAATLLITLGAAGIYFYFYKYQKPYEKTVEVALMPKPQPEIKPAAPVENNFEPQEELAVSKPKKPLKSNISKDFKLESENNIAGNNTKTSPEISIKTQVAQPQAMEMTAAPLPGRATIVRRRNSISEADDISEKLSKKLSPTINATEISGKVISLEDNLPIPGAQLTIAGTNIQTNTDAKGVFNLPKEALGKTLKASYLGHITQEKMITADDTLIFALNASSGPLSEVIVTGYSNQSNIKGEALPVKGWDDYNNYLKQVAKKVNGKTALVSLQFKVNNMGNLSRFEILKSTDKSFNNLAIELIKNGPKWQKNNSNKSGLVKLTINFNN